MTLVSFLIYCITQALGNIYIRLNPPTDLGIIESTLQIVHSDITIIVISSVAERINIGNVSILGRGAIQELSCYVDPRVVGSVDRNVALGMPKITEIFESSNFSTSLIQTINYRSQNSIRCFPLQGINKPSRYNLYASFPI